MGSIEVFPRNRSSSANAELWRSGPVPGSGAIKVREARLEDYAAIRALQRDAAPQVEPWSLKQLESQRHAFAAGQMVAVCEGQVVGAASSLVVRWEPDTFAHTWRGITAEGFFTTHDPHGRTLYGARLVMDTSRHGFVVGRALSQARRRLCRRLNLRRIIATSRLAGYRAFGTQGPPELYAQRVIWGDIADAAMRFQISQGFQYCGVLHDYLPEDTDSCGHAALLAWLNPLYAPPSPPAFEESQRQRKCA